MSLSLVNTATFDAAAENAWVFDTKTTFGILRDTEVPKEYNVILEVAGDFNTLLSDVKIQRMINGTDPATTKVTGGAAGYAALQTLLLGTQKTAGTAASKFSFALKDPEHGTGNATKLSAADSKNMLDFWMYAASLTLSGHTDGSSVSKSSVKADITRYEAHTGIASLYVADASVNPPTYDSKILQSFFDSLAKDDAGEKAVGSAVDAKADYFRALMNFLLASFDGSVSNTKLSGDPEAAAVSLALDDGDSLGLQFKFAVHGTNPAAKVLILLHQNSQMDDNDWNDVNANTINPKIDTETYETKVISIP